MLEDDEIDDMPIQRVFVAACDVPLPIIHAPRSVFDLALGGLHMKHGAKANGGVKYGKAKYRKESAEGVTVVTGMSYPDGRLTPEKIEAERIRRAKQVLPKPPKSAKTISKRFRELVNE